VISLANRSNVVGEVASRLGDFAARWIQSASTDLDVIVATTLDAEWARLHQPVLSVRGGDHVLYTRYQSAHPDGSRVICGLGCSAPLRAKPRRNLIRITCTKCRSRCTVPFRKLEKQTALGQHDLVRVECPPPRYPVSWEVSAPGPDGGDDSDDSDDSVDANVHPPTPIPRILPVPIPQNPPTPIPRSLLAPIPRTYLQAVQMSQTTPSPPTPLAPPPPPPPSSCPPPPTTVPAATTRAAPSQSSLPKIRIPPRPPPIVRTSSEPTTSKRKRIASEIIIDTYLLKRQGRSNSRK